MGAGNTRLGQALLASALMECEAIRLALARQGDDDEAIHEARKAVRRLRALLAFAQGRVDGIAAIDARLDRLGDGLSSLRDAQVAVATSRRLGRRHPQASWPKAVAALAQQRATLLARERARDPAFARRLRALARVESRLPKLEWRLRRQDLRARLKHAQRRARKAKDRAAATPFPPVLHRWRRRARRLRMQLEALKGLAPGLAREVADPSFKKQLRGLHELTEALGDYQDLRVLRGLLLKMHDLPERQVLLAQLNDAKLLAYLDFTPHRKLATWVRRRGGFAASARAAEPQ